MNKPLPVPTPTSQPFWDGLRKGKILLQYSPSTEQWVFYPRKYAPGTLAADLEWREVSGEGRLYTFAVARRPTAPPWQDEVPQLLAVVELKEGVRVSTELVNVRPEDIKIGMLVHPVFTPIPNSEMMLLQYQPA
jgi:uncharacterized protein